ncbi:MAG: hypothetical protein LUG99_00295 [Lachnospiraceae bacterium]|nr:hypothetical protein [Lachnospiraceae bacterium]
MVDPKLTKQEKARQLRYKKPLVKDICLDLIQEFLWDAQSECTNAQYYFDSEDDTLLNALDGDEEEEQEFKMMFADLEAECEQMQNDLEQEYVPECFDEFFAATYSHSMGLMMGYDTYEQDYYGLNSWETEAGTSEARNRMMRMTKKELLDVAKYCIKIFVAYEGLRSRYESLKAALDIIRDVNTAQLQVAQRINELYDQAEKDGFYGWKDAAGEYKALLSQIPQIEWLK